MKSLVKELRAGAELEEAYDADGIIRTGYQLSLRWRAAAEIERLQKELAEKDDYIRTVARPVGAHSYE